MTASLTLTGSIAALAAALQAFEAAQRKDDNLLAASNYEEGVARTVTPLDTGAGIPQPIPTVPMPSMSPVSTTIPTGEDDDEGGEPSDGSGVDAEGLPWDERIHSSSKKKTANGVWASRRGGPKGAELAAIKDQLRGVTQMPMPLPAALAPVPMPSPVIEQPVPMPSPVIEQPVPMPAVMPPPVPMPMPVAAPPAPLPTTAPEPVAAPLPTTAPAADEEWDFAKLMAQIGPKMGSTIDPAYLAQVCQHYGISAITDTATRPDLIGQLVAQFQADGRW